LARSAETPTLGATGRRCVGQHGSVVDLTCWSRRVIAALMRWLVGSCCSWSRPRAEDDPLACGLLCCAAPMVGVVDHRPNRAPTEPSEDWTYPKPVCWYWQEQRPQRLPWGTPRRHRPTLPAAAGPPWSGRWSACRSRASRGIRSPRSTRRMRPPGHRFLDRELVVAAPKVLHQGMAGQHDGGTAVLFEPAHRP
jgi:hypothetical protein